MKQVVAVLFPAFRFFVFNTAVIHPLGERAQASGLPTTVDKDSLGSFLIF